MRRLWRDERGAALVVTLLVVVVGTMALGAAGTLAHGTARAAGGWRDGGAVRYVAESGVNEAMYLLKFNQGQVTRAVYPGDPPSFSSNGLLGTKARYDVWVWDDPADPRDKRIVALGVQGDARQLVRATMRPLQEEGPFPGGDPVVGANESLPVVPPPAGLQPVPLLSLDNPNTYYLGYPPPASLGPKEVYVPPHLLQEAGDGLVAVYYAARLSITSKAKVVICDDPQNPVPVHIWVAGDSGSEADVYFAGQSDINLGGDPTRLVIWVPGTASINIDLEGQSKFCGCIYAPFSHLYVGGQAAITGGARVGSMEVAGQGEFMEIEGIPWPAGAQLDYQVVDYE